MRFDPALRLLRMVVIKSGQIAWDEEFHLGVNIIRSDGNSGGKSSIADLIFYGLGGDFATWKDEAGSCDSVYCEVMLSGSLVTLRRDIAGSFRQPMWVFFGSFDDSQSAGAVGWQKYPYTRAGARESFTQVVFRALGMPEVPSEAEGNLTMHQLLRLMYVDQMTPVDRIFRLESNDSPLRRQAVGDVMMGLFDNRIYPAQLRLREKQKSYDAATTQLAALTSMLGRVDNDYKPEALEMMRLSLVEKRRELLQLITDLKRARFAPPAGSDAETGLLHKMQADLEKLNTDIAELKLAIGQITYEIADAEELISDTERTLAQLAQADTVRGTLGPVALDFCPNCLGPLKAVSTPGTCRLCHEPTEPEEDRSRYARMRNELSMQLKESVHLQASRKGKQKELKDRASALEVMRNLVATEFLSISESFVSEADSQIDVLSTQVGYIDHQLVDIERQSKIASEVDTLRAQKAALNAELSELKDSIGTWERQRAQRQTASYDGVRQATAEILSKDTQSEAEFTTESDVYFNFAEDRISINGKYGFSASSLTVIRNAFHLALHWRSCADPGFNYPRFLLMDNIEDKGMVMERSQNFQRIVIQVSENIKAEHQIIFTTSMLDPNLDVPEYTVGEKYTYNKKSLKIARPVQ